eukprot:scaffold7526_cov115-Skeletonema_dohrnii-CCMP3373.AAC.9
MPSRKKARGKARKAAKEAAKAEEGERQAVIANQRQVGPHEALMQWLSINVATPPKCQHGLVDLSPGDLKICQDFIRTFIAVFTSREDLMESFIEATTVTEEKYPDVYYSKLDSVVSILLTSGTQHVLDGDNCPARLFAILACYFDEWINVKVRKTKAIFNWSRIFEFDFADDHTLVKYLRKSISCPCLDKKYKEVKCIAKMGFCYNPGCSCPNQTVERSKMFSCARCGEANYCSVECQRAAWKIHREECGKIAKVKAAFDSKRRP